MRDLLTGRNLLIAFVVFVIIDVIIYFTLFAGTATKGERAEPVPTVTNPQALVTLTQDGITKNKGSGYYINNSGRMLTAHHVIADSQGNIDDSLIINNDSNIIIEQLFFHPTQDIALIGTSEKDTACIPIESSQPYLGDHATLVKSLTHKIEPGMSGSPLFSNNYSAIGVLVAKHMDNAYQGKYELLTQETIGRINENIGNDLILCST